MSTSDLAHLILRDGREVDVRPLEPRDRAGLAAAIGGLSDESRYLRFATTKTHLSGRELDYLVDIDHHGHEALLAIDPMTHHGVAVVRYVQVPGEPGVVEIAATVADDWQGRGLGTALLSLLAERACQEGHRTLRASVLAANGRSIGMLRRGGFTPRGGSGILREYERRLACASPSHAVEVPVGCGGEVEKLRDQAELKRDPLE